MAIKKTTGRKSITKKTQSVSPQGAWNLADELLTSSISSELEEEEQKLVSEVRNMSFYDFLVNIWSHGYEHRSHFEAWYIREIAEQIQIALENNTNISLMMPRGHLKSTIMHGLAIYLLLWCRYKDTKVIYLSASQEAAKTHVMELKHALFRNDKLRVLHRHVSDADSKIYFKLAGGHTRLLVYYGYRQIKRGMHANGALIMDDIYDDPNDPLTPTQILQDNERYDKTIKDMPNPGSSSQFLIGTPISDKDLFTILPDRETWEHLEYNVDSIRPGSNDETLAPHIKTRAQVNQAVKENYAAAQSELFCRPYYDSNSIITREDFTKLVRKGSISHDLSLPYNKTPGEITVLGADIGRVEDPSHFSVFSKRGNVVRQIYQRFYDQVSLVTQIQVLNNLVDVFDIDAGGIDNTNTNLQDFGVNPVLELVRFTTPLKQSLSNAFLFFIRNALRFADVKDLSELVEGVPDNADIILEFIDDPRQKAHVTSVDKALKTPRTRDGHGDAFFSIALAFRALRQYESDSEVFVTSTSSVADREETADALSRIKRLGLEKDVFGLF